MSHRLFALPTIVLALAMLPSTDAAATVQRTFVASTGKDTNACSLAQPCRSFAAAIAQTSSGGEVIVLDSAGYGTVDVNKSISLIAPPGIHAGISVFDNQVGVLMTSAGLTIVLRGLSITGQGVNNSGINFSDGSTLHVEGCVISNLNGYGIEAYAGKVFVKDSIIRGNTGGGVLMQAAALYLDRVRIEGNGGHGITMYSGLASLTDAQVRGNSTSGINISGGELHIDRTHVERNGAYGIDLSNSHLVALHSVIAANGLRGVNLSASIALPLTLADFDATTISGNGGSGIWAGTQASGNVKVAVTRSVLAQNLGDGLHIAGDVSASVSESAVTGNSASGFVSDPGAAYVRTTIVTDNQGYGFRGIGGYVYTFGNNAVAENTLGRANGNVVTVTQF